MNESKTLTVNISVVAFVVVVVVAAAVAVVILSEHTTNQVCQGADGELSRTLEKEKCLAHRSRGAKKEVWVD